MNFKFLVITFLSIISLLPVSNAQVLESSSTNFAPKREFRGVWIASVANIDWPSKPGLSSQEQQQELIYLLNQHQKNGMNALFLQIRPAADAFYSNAKEPWSVWLTGTQGQAPMPNYDPLAFAIQEAHKRGMELHAWINPYRASNTADAKLAGNHISRTHPEWLIKYAGKLQFDPGLPAVQDYISSIIMDVVNRYDIDGVHFDDYFYPYPVAGQKFNDRATYNLYGKGFSNIEDWRRNNVDQLIKRLYTQIHQAKRWVKFGISPFGIWKNKTQDPEGSDTHGLSNYYELYADSKKWIEQGWVDYINPQIYFTFDFRAAPFDVLVDWWRNHTYNRHLYIGMAAYRINERNRSWRNKNEMPHQLNYLRSVNRVQGEVYFSSKSITTNLLGFTDSLRNHFYHTLALPPQMPWLDTVPPLEPKHVSCRQLGKGVQINWQKPDVASDNETASGYVIYRFEGKEEINIARADKIVHISYTTENSYEDPTAQKGKSYFYVVTALDRLKNEGEESAAVGIAVE